MARIIFRSAAELESREAYDRYEEPEQGLGAEFLRRLDARVQIIHRHPEIFPTVYKQVRQGVLRRFPYSVLCFSTDDNLIVVAVFHSSRDPKIWRRRL